MKTTELARVAKAMVAPGKGILAADESIGTANKRFAVLGIAQTEEMRRQYREMLLSMPKFGEYVSGVILFDETIRQNDSHGTPLVEVIANAGSLPGIKLDKGTFPLQFTSGEKITEGLDGLPQRVDEYVELGAKFAKWRAVIDIGPGTPSWKSVHANAHALARYAAICQTGGLVPIVEPEVMMDGDHTLERSFAVHEETLGAVFDELSQAGVDLGEIVLKPSMVISGTKCPVQASVAEVAETTLTALLRWVPAAVAGIAFLSGGQSDEVATAHLNEINRLALERRAPWPITFSYGRALQQPAIAAWAGSEANVARAQAELLHRARLNGLASLAKYEPAMEADKSELAASH